MESSPCTSHAAGEGDPPDSGPPAVDAAALIKLARSEAAGPETSQPSQPSSPGPQADGREEEHEEEGQVQQEGGEPAGKAAALAATEQQEAPTAAAEAAPDPKAGQQAAQEAARPAPPAAVAAQGSQPALLGKGGKPKLPRPEGTLPCPRCGSEDSKWCYYNNYNIKQPRYFCRACQRYWTAGGALRDVPVGAGRRKSKVVVSKAEGGTPAAVAPAAGAAATGAGPPAAAPDPAVVASLGVSVPLNPAVLSQVPGLMLDPALAGFAMGGAKPGAAPVAAAAAALPPGLLTPGLQLPPGMLLQASQLGAGEQLLAATGAALAGPGVAPAQLPGPTDPLSQLATVATLPQNDPALFARRGMGPSSEAAAAAAAAAAGASKPTAPEAAANGLRGSVGPAEDGSVDGRRTRLKTDQSTAAQSLAGLPSVSVAGLPPISGMSSPSVAGLGSAPSMSGMPSPGVMGLGSMPGIPGMPSPGVAGFAGALAAAAGPGSAAALMPPGAATYGGPGSFFGGHNAAVAAAARFGPGAVLGPAHLGTAGPLSSEFFAHASAQAPPHMQHPAAAAMHVQSLGALGAGAPHNPYAPPPPYGNMGGIWPYGTLGSFGSHSAAWPGGHAAAAASAMGRYPPNFGSLPPTGPVAGAPSGLGLHLGGPLGYAGAGSFNPEDVAQALAQAGAQMPVASMSAASAPLSWSSVLAPHDMGGWGVAAGIGMGGGPLGHHPSHLGGQGPLTAGGGFGGLGAGLGMINSMVPTSAAPSGSLLAAAAAAAAGSAHEPGPVPA